jgi:hypothetical protein
MHLREVWQHKIGLATVVFVALLVAARVYGFGLLPPSAPAPAEGRATARVLIDTPQSTMVDLRQSTYDLEELNDRAQLVANAIGTAAVEERIATAAGLSPSEIAVQTPLTTTYAERDGVTGEPSAAYRLDVQADPTVPVIDIGAAAPTEAESVALAAAASRSLVAYIAALPQRGGEALHGSGQSIRLTPRPLGRVEADPLHSSGPALQALIAFLVILAIGSATIVFVSRQRREYHRASEAMRARGAG